jgi:hypothetical protein
MALEEFLVCQNADSVRMVLPVIHGDAKGIKVFPDDSLAGRGFLDLRYTPYRTIRIPLNGRHKRDRGNGHVQDAGLEFGKGPNLGAVGHEFLFVGNDLVEYHEVTGSTV